MLCVLFHVSVFCIVLVLFGALTSDKRQLGASDDGIWLKVGHVEIQPVG